MAIYSSYKHFIFALGYAATAFFTPLSLMASPPTESIFINQVPVPFADHSGYPVTIKGRTYVPLRVIGDTLGLETTWNPLDQSILLQDQTHTIKLQIGKPDALINGHATYIDLREDVPVLTTVPLIQGGLTYVPLRFITEALDCQVRFKDGRTDITTTSSPTVSRSISPWEYQKILGRGMDVDWSKTSQGRAAYNVQAVKDFKAQGISHVRIRIKDAADETLFASLDQQIKDCLDHGIIPIIAYQADELKNDPTPKNIKKVAQWWDTVAKRYQDYDPRLSFDLVIEVTDALSKAPDTLNQLYETVVSTIRESNPTRILMISPRLRSDAAYLNELEIPSDHNNYLMAEWHFYAAGPSKDNTRKLWTTGTPEEKALINEKIDLALAWQTHTGIPTWVGAWMAGNYNDGNDYAITEQVVFAQYMTQQLTEAGIPFAVNSDTKFYDRIQNQWIIDMIPVRDTIWK
ncbi:MAG: cellulase family glycosylhydrolase [Cellulosilyticaceae bacterium]